MAESSTQLPIIGRILGNKVRVEKRKNSNTTNKAPCNHNQEADTPGYITEDNRWTVKGTLPSDVKNLIILKANKYNLDWRWLAAMAYVESSWRTDAGPNKYGYYGLFQFRSDSIGSGRSIYSVEDQTEMAAKNMSNYVNYAKKKGMSSEDCYLYAGLAHNCGPGGAQFLLSKSSSNTVYGMIQVELTLPSSDFKYKTLIAKNKRKEVSEYPVKMKSAYQSLLKIN